MHETENLKKTSFSKSFRNLLNLKQEGKICLNSLRREEIGYRRKQNREETQEKKKQERSKKRDSMSLSEANWLKIYLKILAKKSIRLLQAN